jgi:hypothetical protein
VIGLATATKYTAALLFIPLIATTLPRLIQPGQRRTVLQHLLLAMALSLAIFLLICPFTILNFEVFLKDFSYEQEHVARGHFGQNTQMPTILFYATALWSIAGIAVLAAVGGLVKTVQKRDRSWGIVFVWIGAYLLVIASWEMRSEHYFLPIIPTILLAGALGMDWLTTRLKARWRTVALSALVILYLWPQGGMLKEHYAAVSAPETRAQAATWIESKIPPGKLVAL